MSDLSNTTQQFPSWLVTLLRLRPFIDRLVSSGLRIFFFPRNQEDLAGTNGLESMREPFLDTRIAVVLFTAPWGETPWTRVEATAIQERCLQKGWDSLMFAQLDTTSGLPRWLPSTHIRFAFEQYGVDQLVGAIKLRIQSKVASCCHRTL